MDESEQLTWDTLLLQGWRKDFKLAWAMYQWEKKHGKKIELEKLLRAPRTTLPWSTRIQFFVAHYLPKINDRMWDQPVERDAALIAKLQTSKYDTLKKIYKSQTEKEKDSLQYHAKKAKSLIELGTKNANDRNHATDWNVVKGGRTRRIR